MYKALEELGFTLAYEIPYAYHQGTQVLKGPIEESNLLPLYQEVQRNLAGQERGGTTFVQGHFPYNKVNADLLASLGYIRVVMLRDPRAVVVSFMFHVLNTEHPLRPYLLALSDNDDRLLASIQGVTSAQTGMKDIFLKGIGQRFRHIADWLKVPGTLELRFENLIGPRGSGNIIDQVSSLEKISSFLNIHLEHRQLEQIAGRIFDTTSETFREGQINGWRSHFKKFHVEALKESVNDVLLEFGYETNPDW